MATNDRRDVSFNVKDIENLFRGELVNRPLDCTDLYRYFQTRVANNARLSFNIDINADGELDKIFFVVNQGAYQVWRATEGSIILFDTKHGTNRYGLKLGLLSSVDSNGRTQVLAASFIESENTESFNWVFEQFKITFGAAPKVVYTDSDKAMEAAISQTWQESTHLLCTFHLWKNFYEHIHSIIKTDDEAWKTICSNWWRLCKESDVAMQAEFDSEWMTFEETIKANSSPEGFEKQQQWLQSVCSRKKKWASCFTWSHCTFGIHSTAQAEAIHLSLAHFCSKHSTALDIANDIEVMCEGQQRKTKLHDEHQIMADLFNAVIGRQYKANPIVDRIGRDLVLFARHLLTAQAAQIVHYDCTISSRGEDGTNPTYMVSRQNFATDTGGSLCFSSDVHSNNDFDYGIHNGSTYRKHTTTFCGCSCQFTSCWRLPCRHVLRLLLAIGSTNVTAKVINDIQTIVSCVESSSRL